MECLLFAWSWALYIKFASLYLYSLLSLYYYCHINYIFIDYNLINIIL